MGRYLSLLFVILAGVAVAHRRLGPSSPATTSTAERALDDADAALGAACRRIVRVTLPGSVGYAGRKAGIGDPERGHLMQCPKCRGNMRTYERNGVHIERCENCRGIFLDYGELEVLSRMGADLR